MEDSIVSEAIEMVDKFLNLVTIDLDDELDRQLAAAYIFGMLNGQAQKESIAPEDVQALMIRIGIDKLRYSTEVAYQMTQFVIDATDKEFHPTVNAIIHRGLEGYFLYSDHQFDALSEDFIEIVQVVKG
ncbi:Imm48 family immunity protein [Streptococcus australis]|uniref:Imm48 family immunity protein n=1 Tax=Streptococcus australis TaxID=113107 RepID=UPI00232ED837|nr:Imm48 family immunity protein [Streptococcus australis]MDB8642763.1 Imm48 family immunity protein [Streptococcus australis]MDB8645883.1 Imm48 family immunity protein [Streptococcus australis]